MRLAALAMAPVVGLAPRQKLAVAQEQSNRLAAAEVQKSVSLTNLRPGSEPLAASSSRWELAPLWVVEVGTGRGSGCGFRRTTDDPAEIARSSLTPLRQAGAFGAP